MNLNFFTVTIIVLFISIAMTNAYDIKGELQFKILMWIKLCGRHNQIMLYSGKIQELGGKNSTALEEKKLCIKFICNWKCKKKGKKGICHKGKCFCYKGS